MTGHSRFSGFLVLLLVVGTVAGTVGATLAAGPTADAGPTVHATIGDASVGDAQLARRRRDE